tara:strand:+ start:2593 stop:2892 length:300 start_codon:yes stop_codon:yes gene_type:complete
MEIAIIGDKDAILGFKLAGIKDNAEFNEETIQEDISRFKEAKIIILTEDVAKYVRERKLDKNYQGVIVEVPNKKGSTGEALKEISRLFEQAIGVKLKEN